MNRLSLFLLLGLAGAIAIASGLRGRNFALLRLDHDRDGSRVSAPPAWPGIAPASRGALDYRIQFRHATAIPRATGGDAGLADVRADIAWVRDLLSVGDDFHTDIWWLRDIVLARQEGRRFMCDTYSRALANIALRQDMPARIVLLDGHITSEIFLPRLGRWVFADALYDFIAMTPEGRPLSILDTVRRLRAGDRVLWKSVTGVVGDDDALGARNRARLEDMLRNGRFTVCDGEYGFGRLTRRDRARDLLLGRVHAIQYVSAGAAFDDRDESALRALLVVWCAVSLALATWSARRRPAAAPGTARA